VNAEAPLGQAPARVQEARHETQLLLAMLAWATALIHVLAAAHHYREWVLYGVFFTILAPAQAIWGVLVVRRPGDRRLLAAGGAVNLAVACVWGISRTTGIPVGPTAWRPEAIGWHDVMATLNELAMAAIVAGMLRMLPLSDERFARATRYVAVPLLLISVLAASLAHHH
jgi:hypothetical protein